jgi:hypothetical protein
LPPEKERLVTFTPKEFEQYLQNFAQHPKLLSDYLLCLVVLNFFVQNLRKSAIYYIVGTRYYRAPTGSYEQSDRDIHNDVTGADSSTKVKGEFSPTRSRLSKLIL